MRHERCPSGALDIGTLPGTAGNDLIDKTAAYRARPSIQHYVILQLSRSGGVRRLPAIGVDVPLAEIYAGAELAPPSTENP
jgi:hypothetical protein